MLSGALAGCTGVTFSNPFDHAKVRLQLQGELKAQGKYEVFFKNSFDCVYKIAKYEGILKVQNGLSAAYCYHILMNGTRLGSYESVKTFFKRHTSLKENSSALNLATGMAAGFIGSAISLPFTLVKVRLQSDHPHQETRHNYKGLIHAFRCIWRTEGPRGFLHGINIWPIALAWTSGVQLTIYDLNKNILTKKLGFTDSLLTQCVSAIIAGLAIPVFCNPTDCLATRMLNQKWDHGHGVKYNGLFDCMVKTARIEGIRGLYKGFTGFASRQVPHTLISLVSFEFYKKEVRAIFGHKELLH